MGNEKRLIYADSGQELVEHLKRHLIVGDSEFLRGYLRGVESLADGLAKLPPVDAVEVVRCKDCKYWGQDGSSYSGDFESFCTNPDGLDNYAHPDDFCSYGVRKDGDWNG